MTELLLFNSAETVADKLEKPTLRKYQQDAVDAGLSVDNGLLVLPTGSGKSHVIAELVINTPGQSIILQPTKEILESNLAKIEHAGLRDVGVYSASMGEKRLSKVTYATIGSIIKIKNQIKDCELLIIDEAHLTNAQGGMYLDFIKTLDPKRIIGLTATPYRLHSSSGEWGSSIKMLTRTRPKIWEDIIHVTQSRELIEQGFLIEPRFVVSGQDNHKLLRSNSTGAEYSDYSMQVYRDKTDLLNRTVHEIAHAVMTQSKHILVFVDSLKANDYVVRKVREHKISISSVDGKTPKKERESKLKSFRNGEIRVIVNVGILTTGYDFPELDCIVGARPTMSLGLNYQMCLDEKTEILTKSGWKTCNGIADLDLVAAFDMQTEQIEFVPIENKVDRKLMPEETMYGISNPMLDIRVTNLHSIIFRKRIYKGKVWTHIRTKWQKIEAQNLTSKFEIPCAGFNSNKGVQLTDYELQFVGWVLTDGHVNKKTGAVTISQGEHQPWNKSIEECLIGCGFKYTRAVRDRNTQFNQSSKNVTYIISKGKPRGTKKHLRGCGALLEYLDKDIADTLFDMTTPQFKIFLEAVHLGDGSKQGGQSWTRRSYHICSARKLFVDRLQILCTINGFASNSAMFNFNKNPIWLIHIKPSYFRSIFARSSDGRPFWKELKHETNERVWCITNKLGTIVTRRNGKVSIVGNCGRSVRPHPEKDGVVVYDLVNNFEKFGNPFDMMVVKGSTGLHSVLSSTGRLTGRKIEGVAEIYDSPGGKGQYSRTPLKDIPEDFMIWYLNNAKKGAKWHMFDTELIRREIFNGK